MTKKHRLKKTHLCKTQLQFVDFHFSFVGRSCIIRKADVIGMAREGRDFHAELSTGGVDDCPMTPTTHTKSAVSQSRLLLLIN